LLGCLRNELLITQFEEVGAFIFLMTCKPTLNKSGRGREGRRRKNWLLLCTI